MVLLGGVSIFGGSGTLWGVLLSILIILNLRNGMSLANMSGHIQTGVDRRPADPVGAGAEPGRQPSERRRRPAERAPRAETA